MVVSGNSHAKKESVHMKNLKTIYVVLGLPPSTLALIVRANAIVTTMEANKGMFPSATPAFTVASGHITDLHDAETVAKQTHATGSAAARDDKQKIVIADMHQYHGYVQQLANATPANAEAIAQAAAMSLRKSPSIHKSDLSVKQAVTGVVHLVAKAVKGGHAYEWQYSTDGGKTWTSAPVTLAAHATITGLQIGVVTTFRHRAVTKTGPLDWGAPVSAAVS